MTPEQEKLVEDLRAKHSTVYVVEDPDTFGLVVFKRPTKLDFRALKKDRDDEDRKSVSDEIFAQKIVVYPDAAGFNALLDQYPLLSTNISGEAMKVSGGAKLEVKKF